MKLSIVVPIINSTNIKDIYNNIINTLKKIKYEIIFISYENNDELNNIYDNDIVHVRVIYLNKKCNINTLINTGINYSSGKYTIIIDNNFNTDNLYTMLNILEEDNIDIVSTGYDIDNKHIYKLDSYGYRMFNDNVKNNIIKYNYSNDIFYKLNYKTKYLELDKNDINYSFIKEFVKRNNMYSIKCYIISFIFIIISIISLIFKNIELFSIWFGFSILILLLSKVFKYIDINNNEDIFVKETYGFNEKNIL